MQPWWLSPCYKRNCSANFRWRKYPQWLELLSYCHLKVPWSHVVLLWWWCCKVLHLFSSRCWVDASSAAAEWALLSGGALLPMGWALSGSSLGALTLPASGAAAGLHGCAAPSVAPRLCAGRDWFHLELASFSAPIRLPPLPLYCVRGKDGEWFLWDNLHAMLNAP